MIQKKICMLGAFAVGKTSLVARFITSMFSDKYHTTVGVKIDKKALKVQETDVNLLLWDVYGEDDFNKVRMSYLRGAAGYLLVVDGTRRASLETAFGLHKNVEATLGNVPFVLALNKADLAHEWELDEAVLADINGRNWHVIRTSAKTGQGVEEAFQTLAQNMLRV